MHTERNIFDRLSPELLVLGLCKCHQSLLAILFKLAWTHTCRYLFSNFEVNINILFSRSQYTNKQCDTYKHHACQLSYVIENVHKKYLKMCSLIFQCLFKPTISSLNCFMGVCMYSF